MDESLIKMVEPEFCQGCGWKPTRPNNEKQEIAVENRWLIIAIPNSVVWLYVCPSCHLITTNQNCVENVKELIKIKSSKIISPSSGIVKPELRTLPKKDIYTRN